MVVLTVGLSGPQGVCGGRKQHEHVYSCFLLPTNRYCHVIKLLHFSRTTIVETAVQHIGIGRDYFQPIFDKKKIVPGKSSRRMVQFPSFVGHFKQTEKQKLEKEAVVNSKEKYVIHSWTTCSRHEVITTESMGYESRSWLLKQVHLNEIPNNAVMLETWDFGGQ